MGNCACVKSKPPNNSGNEIVSKESQDNEAFNKKIAARKICRAFKQFIQKKYGKSKLTDISNFIQKSQKITSPIALVNV